ncbi:MAG: hypothetical protein EP338_06280 [Bacteroidetes bacterium]|nr:MAG: hypothetical protein EP338_06280 [Bacteroidota bacterium]
MENKKQTGDLRQSHYTMRKVIGIMGLSLPFIILPFHEDHLTSISHYYYTKSAVFFLVIMAALGLFLMTYKGYESRPEDQDWLTDNMITNIAGAAALMVVLIPTNAGHHREDLGRFFKRIGEDEILWPLFGHNEALWGTVHLSFAAVFLFGMGWMAFFRFTRSDSKKIEGIKRWENFFYRFTGILIWASIIFLGLQSLLLLFDINFRITKAHDVYWLETISVLAFGTAWLIKGRAIRELIELKQMILSKSKISTY